MEEDDNDSHVDEKSSVFKAKSRSTIDGLKESEENDHGSNKYIAKCMLTDECKEGQEGNIIELEPEEKIIEAEVQDLTEAMNMNSLSSPVETASASVVNETMNGNPPCSDHAKHSPSMKFLPKLTGLNSLGSDKKLEPKFNISERKHHFPSSKSHYDEDDTWSLSSSITTSTRNAKITVPVAPRFICVDRLQRRKEFYSKLEDKHKALEKEKIEYEARIKEEEQTALKLLRKNMSYKANPVPSFYNEGPPAKAKLKKIPVTRAKSPNLGRRKSCSDAVAKASPSGVRGRGSRRSIGVTANEIKAGSPVSSKGNDSPKPNGSRKVAVES